MSVKRTVVVASALLAWATVAFAAEERVVPCKNHYILDEPCPPPDGPTATVRVAKLYSTRDATIQAVELEVVRFGSEPLLLAGRAMTVRDRHGGTRSFRLGEAPVSGVSRLLVLGSAWMEGLSGWWGSSADLEMPDYFLPTDGGVLAIEGMDEVDFGPLPENGWQALARDGAAVTAYFGHWGYFDIQATTVIEFHHAGLDHYFMTDRADEIALLKSGAIPGWQLTGKALQVLSRPYATGYYPVCRYLLERPGSYSHFFSASKEECDALVAQPGNRLESAAVFWVGLPVDGVCATRGTIAPGGVGVIGGPVYRLWNGKPDTNHRFVTEKSERDAMIARGWIPEGQGLDGVAMCAWSSEPPP